MREAARRRFVPVFYLAQLVGALGDLEGMAQLYEDAYAARSGWLPFIMRDPGFDHLRHDPRFRTIRQRMAIPGT